MAPQYRTPAVSPVPAYVYLFSNEGPAFQDSPQWVFESYCIQLGLDMFGARWEQRHGAVTALRELVRLHGQTGGMRAASTDEENRGDTAPIRICNPGLNF